MSHGKEFDSNKLYNTDRLIEKSRHSYEISQASYMERTPQSKRSHELASIYIPGGDTRSICFHEPYPLTIKRGEGSYLFDVDGNHYVDLLNNYTSMIHGHAHPTVVEGVQKAIGLGTAYAASISEQAEFAELLCKRVPSLENIRFCNSGTEAIMFTIHAARAFTGKSSIIKTDGGYHGTHDVAAWNSNSDNRSLSKSIDQDIYSVPFNQADAMEELLLNKSDEVAAILVEPVMGLAGVIAPESNYLQKLRELANKYNVLLIFDEVQTLRLHVGGAQAMYGVEPDLTAIGKIIGGGFPVGAFGGKEEIMKMYNPLNNNFLPHGGTFNGNRITMTAGILTMKLLDEDAINTLEALAKRLKGKIDQVIEKLQIPVFVTRVGSMMNIHFTVQEPTDYSSAISPHDELMKIMHIKLLNNGVFIAPRGLMCLSTVMTEKDIEFTEQVFSNVLMEMSKLFD